VVSKTNHERTNLNLKLLSGFEILLVVLQIEKWRKLMEEFVARI